VPHGDQGFADVSSERIIGGFTDKENPHDPFSITPWV
jgi:hypothetical protein